jgi:hypothetical protein
MPTRRAVDHASGVRKQVPWQPAQAGHTARVRHTPRISHTSHTSFRTSRISRTNRRSHTFHDLLAPREPLAYFVLPTPITPFEFLPHRALRTSYTSHTSHASHFKQFSYFSRCSHLSQFTYLPKLSYPSHSPLRASAFAKFESLTLLRAPVSANHGHCFCSGPLSWR